MISESISSMTEEEAVSLFLTLARTFEWQGTIFRRKDIEDSIERPLTDDEWHRIMGVAQFLTQRGWEILDSLLADTLAD